MVLPVIYAGKKKMYSLLKNSSRGKYTSKSLGFQKYGSFTVAPFHHPFSGMPTQAGKK
jgi:hypothetical protein